MAHATAWHGHLTTVTLATATIDLAELLGFEWSGITRESIETTKINVAAGTPGTNFGNKTFIPAGTSNPGEITLEYNFNPDKCDPPIDVGIEEIVVTWTDGAADAAAWTVNGFCTGYSLSVATDEKMTCSVTYQLTDHAVMS